MNETIRHAGPAPAADPATPVVPVPAIGADGRLKLSFGANRSMVLKQHDLLAEFRFIEAVGGVMADNGTWMNMSMPMIFLVELDGIPVSQPASKLEVEALISRLKHDGYKAMVQGINAHFKAEPNVDAIKNG